MDGTLATKHVAAFKSSVYFCNFNQKMHAVVIRFIITFLKTLIYALPDNEQIRSETCRNLEFLKILL